VYEELTHNKVGPPKFCFGKFLMCSLFKKEENVVNTCVLIEADKKEKRTFKIGEVIEGM
jgi:hypothetical protein